MPSDQIQYSEKYYDDVYEYRHVILPQDLARNVPKSHLMTETEWRNLGVQQSPGWVMYMMHAPEPHILLFRRPRTDGPRKMNSVAGPSGTNPSKKASRLTAV
ncbi:cyclin-dependent kinases regulatory subunit-like [Uranotaenia lowii]|uniref:cyclin-dependent kinases regulatory subunit-like n=1 Tax=Uranotaenia lowii TaxID=190385 RepID=UPI00247A2A21|nr:cyclin-dependent kinases regulatory subunit-like [Uranotaenia lowii]XP_055611980.1 cyclin-dependent kinases regulatory subunit-like [Uranotaenia lowii]